MCHSDRSTISEQSKRIAELEASNEKMRNMLLAVKSHMATQKQQQQQQQSTTGAARSPRSSASSPSSSTVLSNGGSPPGRLPSPPPEPPLSSSHERALPAGVRRPEGDVAINSSPKKFQRNTLPLMGALGELLDAAAAPAEPPEDDANDANDANDDDSYLVQPSAPLDPSALGPNGKPLDAKVREILSLQEDVARQRRLRNAPSPTAMPTKSILKKPGDSKSPRSSSTNAATAVPAEPVKEKKSFFKRSSTSGKLLKDGKDGKVDAATPPESTQRPRVRFTDSQETREERLASAGGNATRSASSNGSSSSSSSSSSGGGGGSGASTPKRIPTMRHTPAAEDDESPPPSPPPSDSSPMHRLAGRAPGSVPAAPAEPPSPAAPRVNAGGGSKSSSSGAGASGAGNKGTGKSKAIDDAWRSIEQDLFD